MSDPFVVKQSFIGNLGGGDLHFRAGDLFAADHQAVKKWPHLFGPSQPVVEQATAAPGEKRASPLRRRAAKAKATPKATAAQEAGMANQLKVEAADAMPEPKPIPEPEPEKAPAGKAMTTASFEGK